ncbi:type II toxin-antitoxin system toxin DNA ADP-ribosyl transferase DarT [Rhizobium leguminosarum]|uniref:type II toxin-antitoxin system toxin DNA ADP-ribosyl transferase DarT n=1 Tax=Rhizobium leguminosarum TaxID=384 RepID=UPI00102F92ED|nr:DUF4433 domain-containing protein [Rhizobium leguminosarum]TAZ00094.1 DUF4433 domain-containing protein [Rhizobium leguminosarum]TAZ10961.1 DUF4433 domain-containing protein [Rhizobium leguminosarum]
MTQPPVSPKIYHIVNVDRLPSIIASGSLYCDSEVIRLALPGTNIGMSDIKQSRLRRPVPCHAGTMVGNYVPFYFCPRSMMLYIISRANNPKLTYTGGQGPIVHLEADLHKVIAWANAEQRRWAFSDANGNAAYAQFWADTAQLHQLNWQHIASTDFRQQDVRDAKQAEFMIHHNFPWHLVDRIGVLSQAVFNQATNALNQAAHRPPIEIIRQWYY